MMKDQLQAIATLFSLINPVVCVLIFSGLSQGRTAGQRKVDATKAVLTIGFVLILAAFLGAPVLRVFGISFDAFSVAGGIVLAFIGFSMLIGTPSTTHAVALDDAVPATSDAPPSLARLILFAASPGTITGVITSATNHAKSDIPVITLIAIVTVLAITWILLAFTTKTSTDKGSAPSLGRDMTTRYMGLIVVAMGIQFALTGYKAFMAG